MRAPTARRELSCKWLHDAERDPRTRGLDQGAEKAARVDRDDIAELGAQSAQAPGGPAEPSVWAQRSRVRQSAIQSSAWYGSASKWKADIWDTPSFMRK